MLSVVQDDYSEPRPKSLAEAIEERAKDKEWRGCLDSKIFKLQSQNGQPISKTISKGASLLTVFNIIQLIITLYTIFYLYIFADSKQLFSHDSTSLIL